MTAVAPAGAVPVSAPVVLSLGAGVQSTALALLSIEGHLPPLDLAIFADTGWEPPAVYEQLRRISDALAAKGVPTHIVSNGNIRADALSDGRFASMPLHMKGDGGNGMGRRQCTNEYKLVPIKRKIREILGATPIVTKSGQPSVSRVGGRPGVKHVEMWVGISTDEIERQRPADVQYIRRVDPLIDILDMSRDDCIAYLTERWPWPVERSACIGCPFHDNEEWRSMRENDPESFADAVEFDVQIRSSGLGTFKSEAYLHEQRVPLTEANLDIPTRVEIKRRQLQLGFDGCSPWGCRTDGAA